MPAPQQQKPVSQTMGLLIALSILIMVGFLVIYFKIDLEAQLAANNTAILSQQVMTLQVRMDKLNVEPPADNTGAVMRPTGAMPTTNGGGMMNASGTVQNY